MSEISEKMKVYLESEVGKSALKLINYTIRSTKTLKDDEILDNVDEIIDIVSATINSIGDVTVTTDEAKESAMVILKTIAEATPTKWDDRVIPIIDMFL